MLGEGSREQQVSGSLLTCAGVVLELVTMATEAAVAPRGVLTAPVGAGSQATLVDICKHALSHTSPQPSP